MSASKIRFSLAIAAGVILPPGLALLFTAITVGSSFKISSLLVPLSMANALPFLPLYLLGYSDLNDVERGRLASADVRIRLAGSYVVMFMASTAIDIAIVHSGLSRSQGSSTDPVAIFTSPIILFIGGLCGYVLFWAGTSVWRTAARSRK